MVSNHISPMPIAHCLGQKLRLDQLSYREGDNLPLLFEHLIWQEKGLQTGFQVERPTQGTESIESFGILAIDMDW